MTYACRHSVVRAIPLAKRRHHAAPRRPPNSFPSIGMRNFGCRVWKLSNRNPGGILKQCLSAGQMTRSIRLRFSSSVALGTRSTLTKGAQILVRGTIFFSFGLFRREKRNLDFGFRFFSTKLPVRRGEEKVHHC